MRIPSGSTDRMIGFVALDSSGARLTGLSSFTVYRTRNGGTPVAMTSPTIVEDDAVNCAGDYSLLLDEDTTIDAGHDTEELKLRISATGMKAVTRAVELYRPKATEGNTLAVASDGDVNGNVNGSVNSVLVKTGYQLANNGLSLVNAWTVNITGSLSGSVGSVTGSVGSIAGTIGTLDALAAYGDTAWVTATGFSTLTSGDIDARLAAYDAPTKAEMDAAFAEVKGATWSSTTDTLEALRDRGDAAWTTAAGFSTHSAADVRTEIDANSTQLAAIIAAVGALNNPTVAAIADAVCDELLSGHATAGSLGKAISDILDDTGTSGVVLSSATRDAIATSLLDLAAGVETNLSVRQYYRLMTSALLSLCSGMGGASGVFRDFNNTKNRIQVTTDANGNRTAFITRDAT